MKMKMEIDVRLSPHYAVAVNGKTIYMSHSLLASIINIARDKFKISAIIVLREYSKAKGNQLGLAEAKHLVEYLLENQESFLHARYI